MSATTDLVAVHYTDRQLETLRAVIAPGVTDDELALFARVSADLGLSYFRGEIVLIGRWSSKLRRDVYRHQVTVDGRRALASRTGELRGIVGPYWCGPHVPDEDSPLRWLDVWLNDQPPHAARVMVWRKGHEHPYVGTVPWREFAQRNADGTLGGLWSKMPAHMLAKTAEALALRRAFPDVLGARDLSGFEHDDDDMDLGSAPVERVPAEDGPSPAPEPSPRAPAAVTATALPAMAPEQANEIADLFRAIGMGGRDMRAGRLAYLSTLLGRDVTHTGQLDMGDAETVLADLKATLATMARPDDDEAPF
jgi:hypothetical protein